MKCFIKPVFLRTSLLGFLTQRLVDNVGVFVDDLSGLYIRAAVLRFLRTQAVSFLIFFAACWKCSHVADFKKIIIIIRNVCLIVLMCLCGACIYQ